MSFDRVAPYYRWLETLVYRGQLQQARTAFVREIEHPRRVLVVGEGNGRFLEEFVRVHPGAEVDCVEESARMIELSRRAVGSARITFIQADIQTVALPPNSYDLIVTHFLLDCFSERNLERLIRQLGVAATGDARWLVADFCHPPRDWQRLRARVLIATMYFFFRAVTGIEARRLADYRPFLRAEDFECMKQVVAPNGMVRSELWQRSR